MGIRNIIKIIKYGNFLSFMKRWGSENFLDMLVPAHVRGIWAHETGVTDICKPPNVGAGNKTVYLSNEPSLDYSVDSWVRNVQSHRSRLISDIPHIVSWFFCIF